MADKTCVLTGITTTGTPHLGNYIGAIRPAVAASRDSGSVSFYFLADYHALVKCREPERVARSTREMTAAWLALGLDTERAVFYRQSDIPEILHLNWILSCIAAKGLLNRAHAYKAAVAENTEREHRDPDQAITMGLFCYPVLMAADILAFNAHRVPVGRDQVQHVEMARDIAQRFNHHYEEYFTLPEAQLPAAGEVLCGLDGRKMSKSYDNTIPLFAPAAKLRRLVMKIKTNSQPPEEPKDTENCTLFQIYRAFAPSAAVHSLQERYAQGVGWGEVKEILCAVLEETLAEPRRRYEALLADSAALQDVLNSGAERARARSRPLLAKVQQATGIRPLH